EVVQTWNEENQAWEPAVDTTASFNYEATTQACHFVCKDDSEGSFMWDPTSSSCIPRVVKTICTGQAKCSNGEWMESCPLEGEDFFGQDPQYLDKCQPIRLEFKNNDPETHLVIDENTGLEWYNVLKHSDEPENPAPINVSYEDAVQYCAGLTYDNDSSRPWRLPTIKDLLTISNLNYADPTVDNTFFSEIPNGNPVVWSNTPRICTPEKEAECNNDHIWVFGARNASTSFRDSNSGVAYALCVRGDEYDPEQIPESYTIGEDTVVLDRATNLIWNINRISNLKWVESLAYCENMDYAGFTDWRLPNRNEITSIINYNKYFPASDMPLNISAHETTPFFVWTSSIRSVSGSHVWDIPINLGGLTYLTYDYSGSGAYFTICVR
ncbi:DUF1566 domain-containing protein, partial [bacterium]|nr:DUF1566 domain-containing protein [bacterium]